MMYQKIRSLLPTRQLYAQKLIDDGVLSDESIDSIEQEYYQLLSEGHCVSRPIVENLNYSYSARWEKYINREWDHAFNSAINVYKFFPRDLNCIRVSPK